MKFIEYLDTPIGLLEIQASNTGVTKIHFLDKKHYTVNANRITSDCIRQLDEYFYKGRKKFNVSLDLKGTLFQRSIWERILHVKFGNTVSYLDIAIAMKNPKSARAVGAAVGKNPVGIIVPCHRVLGSNGALTGYAGGLERKRWLINHEYSLLNEELSYD